MPESAPPAGDAVAEVCRRARERLTEAEALLRQIDPGWSPPPYDPLLIAQALGIRCLEVSGEVVRGAMICVRHGEPLILYHRQRDPARTRFCLFHEIAHTLFPDWRATLLSSLASPLLAPEGPVERLCDAAALELMMPRNRLDADLASGSFDGDRLLALCRRYGARAEDVAARMIESGRAPACAAVVVEHDRPDRWRRRQPGGETHFALTWATYSQRFRDGGRFVAPRLELERSSCLRATARSGKAAAGVEELPLMASGRHPFRVEALPLRQRPRRRGHHAVLGLLTL